MNVSEQIDNFIRLNGGNERDALNVALARLDAAEARAAELEQERDELILNHVYMNERIVRAEQERDEWKRMYDKAMSEQQQRIAELQDRVWQLEAKIPNYDDGVRISSMTPEQAAEHYAKWIR